MKKLSLIIFAIILIILFFPREETVTKQLPEDVYQVIPEEAIRLRILAHSDDDLDQRIKEEVRDVVSDQVTDWIKDVTNIYDAREMIASQTNEIEASVASVLKAENNNQDFQVDYKSDVTFPMKLYDTHVYPAGEYEAVLITLGAGQGKNWWCVLFPPLCFLDFSAGTTVADEDTSEEELQADNKEVKVKFFLFEWLGWL